MAGEVLNFPLINSYVVGVHYDEPTKPPATSAIAGTPGSFAPVGAEVPEDLGEMTGIVANPVTAWTTGQYVNVGDGSVVHWSGTAWVTGVAADFDPGEATVDDVKAYVEANPDEADDVLAAEVAGKNRTTLVDWLSAR